MKPNSVFFPLTNPSERLDKGRSLAASESACQNPKTTAVLALIRHSSGGCRFRCRVVTEFPVSRAKDRMLLQFVS